MKSGWRWISHHLHHLIGRVVPVSFMPGSFRAVFQSSFGNDRGGGSDVLALGWPRTDHAVMAAYLMRDSEPRMKKAERAAGGSCPAIPGSNFQKPALEDYTHIAGGHRSLWWRPYFMHRCRARSCHARKNVSRVASVFPSLSRLAPTLADTDTNQNASHAPHRIKRNVDGRREPCLILWWHTSPRASLISVAPPGLGVL